MGIIAPKLDASMLLQTLCCHGHFNGSPSSDWLLTWFTNARRVSLALLLLSSIIIYCIPQTRKPAKKGCHLLIDLVAGSLKTLVGKIDDSERVKIVENSKLLVSGIDNPENIGIVLDRLDKLESSPMYSKIENTQINAISNHSKQHNVNFNLPENKRYKKECLQNKSDWLKRRKAFCEIHKPREMKFKEKSVEKVPLLLMQFDTFERQKLSSDSTSSDYDSRGCHRKNLKSNKYQKHFELFPHNFSNNDTYSYPELSYSEFENASLSDILSDGSFDETPRPSPILANKMVKQFRRIHVDDNPNLPMRTISWLSNQIHQFERSLESLSASIDLNVEQLKDINLVESRSGGISTKNLVKPSIISLFDPASTNHLYNTVVETLEANQNVSMPKKTIDKSEMGEPSMLSQIFNWIFGEAKHSTQIKEKKILNIVKQKLL